MNAATGPGLAELLQVLAGLAVVVGAALLFGWLGRRRLAARGGGRLHVEERLSLARGVHLAIVCSGSRRLLVGVSEKGVQLVSELDAAEEIPAAEIPGAESASPTPFPLNFARELRTRLRVGSAGE